MIEISLGEDSIYTNITGFRQLLKFYEECKSFNNDKIFIKIDDIQWLDGNLCAFLGALLYRLKTDNNLEFSLNAHQVSQKFNVLFANNFLPITQNIKQYKKSTCIPFKGFLPNEKDEFIDYLDSELLVHPAMPKLEDNIKEKLIDDLIEVYGNIDKHAKTNLPFFVCGQYFPKQEILHFTICDLGVGFFPAINNKKPQIITCADAILWAIDGNSTKLDAPGGSGLKNLHKYLYANQGGLQIYSGNAGWCSKTVGSILYPLGITDLRNNYIGAIINLEFNKKTLHS